MQRATRNAISQRAGRRGRHRGRHRVRGPPRTSAPTNMHNVRHVRTPCPNAPCPRTMHTHHAHTPCPHAMPAPMHTPCPHPCTRHAHTHGRARRPRRAAPTGTTSGTISGTTRVRGPPGTSAPTIMYNAHHVYAPCTRHVRTHAHAMPAPMHHVRTHHGTHGRAQRPRRAAHTGTTLGTTSGTTRGRGPPGTSAPTIMHNAHHVHAPMHTPCPQTPWHPW